MFGRDIWMYVLRTYLPSYVTYHLRHLDYSTEYRYIYLPQVPKPPRFLLIRYLKAHRNGHTLVMDMVMDIVMDIVMEGIGREDAPYKYRSDGVLSTVVGR
jgi:hypothetical protein